MRANNQLNSKTSANSNAPKQKPNPREALLQGVLETYPLLTREEAEEMLREYEAY